MIRPTTQRFRQIWLLTTLLLVGVVTWMVIAAGPGGERRYGLYSGIQLTLSLLAVFYVSAPYRWLVGPTLVAGALALSPFTASRGDGDGFWILIFPLLIGIGGILTLVAWLTSQLSERDGDRGGPRSDGILAHHRYALALLALLSVATGLVTAWAWPNPWPELEGLLAEFPQPKEFLIHSTEQLGGALCTENCNPRLVRTMTSTVPQDESCTLLKAAGEKWLSDQDSFRTDSECSFRAEWDGGPIERIVVVGNTTGVESLAGDSAHIVISIEATIRS